MTVVPTVAAPSVVPTQPQLAPGDPVQPSPVVTETLVLSPVPTIPPTMVPTTIPTPTVEPQPSATPTQLATIAPPTIPALTNEQRWRNQQRDRVVLNPPQIYTTTGSELWWYDPVNQRSEILGSFVGAFDVQATFTLRSDGRAALEVPYEVNRRYGLTAISPSLLERIRAAGYGGDWIETYVVVAPNVTPR